MSGRTFALGDSYSICDPYLMIFYLWGRFVGMPMSDLAAYSRLIARVVERPAVAKAIAEEQLPMGQAA